jgi:hypothetical protein
MDIRDESMTGFYPLLGIQWMRKDIAHGHRIIERTSRDAISKGIILFVEARK